MEAMRAFLLKTLSISIVFGFFVGVVFLFATTAELAAMNEAAIWPSRDAVVEISQATRVYARGKGHHWRAEIKCRPVEGGEAFWVSHIRRGDWCLGDCESKAREDVARYTVKQRVKVYFDPERKHDTLLESDAPRQKMYWLRLLAALLVMLPFALWLFRKRAP
jgi:hypothetical protein